MISVAVVHLALAFCLCVVAMCACAWYLRARAGVLYALVAAVTGAFLLALIAFLISL